VTTDLALAIGVMITVGLLAGLLAGKLRFPRVTGYIIVGILLSPSVLNLVPRATIDDLGIITFIALGIIAYLIGGSLHLESIRRVGRSIAWITPFQSLGAWLIVALVIAFLAPLTLNIPNMTSPQSYFPMALVLGAMASATAPAAVMAVVREYKAKGSFTSTLLAVVALDDAIAVIAFAIALGIAQPLVNGAGGVSLYQILAVPALEIGQSIGIGAAFGFALIYLAKLVKTRALMLVMVLGMVVLCVGVANILGLSLILANMVVGFVVVNRMRSNEPFLVIEGIEDVVYAVFFVLAGMHFDAGVMKVAGILALLSVASRCSGTYFGTRFGAQVSHASDTVKKYLGFGLLPKAGVTIGLALLAERAFPTFGAIILNGVLASVIINELIAPPLVKYALFKSGEAEQAIKPTSEAE